MRKFFAALAACLCIGALSHPAAAQPAESPAPESPSLRNGAVTSEDPKRPLAAQSHLDSGKRACAAPFRIL